MTARPNVLWISTHDINPHLGCYAGVYPGAEYAQTPHLDSLAGEGMRFDNAFTVAPICAPSRSSLMTGCFPTSIGTMHMRTKAVPPSDVRLLSEYFREAGYYVTNNSFTDFQVQTPVTAFDDCSDTAHWRNRPDPEQPFFATFQGMITHESQIYLDDETFAARTPHVEQRHDPAAAPVPPYHPDTEAFRTSWARYFDLITEMDNWAGRILAQLDEDGLAENTVVVFWTDHGAGLPRFKRWPYDTGLHVPVIVRWPGHVVAGSVNTELIHLMDLFPTILGICGLNVPEHVQARPFLAPDGAPLADVNDYVFGGRDRHGDAEDMSRTLRDQRYRYIRHYHPDRSPLQHNNYPDQTAPWRDLRRLVGEEAGQRAVAERRSRLTPAQRELTLTTKPAEALYDVLADPHETTNLATDPQHAQVLDRMRLALDEWQRRFGDLGFLPEDELAESWRPGGVPNVTAIPHVEWLDGRLAGVCETPGAHLAWTADPPPATPPAVEPGLAATMGSPPDAIGSPVPDGRQWYLLCDATPAPVDGEVWVRACRLGYRDSADIHVTPPADADRARGAVYSPYVHS